MSYTEYKKVCTTPTRFFMTILSHLRLLFFSLTGGHAESVVLVYISLNIKKSNVILYSLIIKRNICASFRAAPGFGRNSLANFPDLL